MAIHTITSYFTAIAFYSIVYSFKDLKFRLHKILEGWKRQKLY